MPPSRIPPLLQPYTRLPTKDSLILLTSVLGASTNWLVIRFLCGALSSAHATKDGGDGVGRLSDEFSGAREGEGESAVVLVSWMRDWEFWRTEGRKAGVSGSFAILLHRHRRDREERDTQFSTLIRFLGRL